MKSILVVLCFGAGLIAAFAQPPDTIFVSATNPGQVFSHYKLKAGTKYIVQATGGISYWRPTAPPPDTPDADAGYVFHVPYQPGVPKIDVDSINYSIWDFKYLPCDGSSCASVPPEFLCGTITNSHNLLKGGSEFSLDRDYLALNGQTFCPRNGGDKTKHIYWQGLMGNNQFAALQFHDGDGDYTNNWGTVQICITRLEPIMRVWKQTLDFGKIRPNSPVPIVLYDTINNVGSPFFPGCTGASAFLQFTVDSVTGDIDPRDGFQLTNVAIGKQVAVTQGTSASFHASFTPKQKRPYKAIMWLRTNDPQDTLMQIVLVGEGIQGLTKVNPADTLDFGDVPLNLPRTLPLEIANIGNDVLHVAGISPENVDPAYTLPNLGARVLAANTSISPTITFSPTRLGTVISSVLVLSDGFGESQHRVVLKGRGVAALLIVDSVLDFGNYPVGDSLVLSLPLKNVGNIAFGVQFVKFSAGDSLDFSAEPRTHIIIEPDSILNWKMGFHPGQPGRRAAVAEIASDGGGAPHYVYVLGNGIVLSKMVTSSALDYGVVSIDTTRTMSVIAKNVGNVPINLQVVSLASGKNWSLPRTVFPTLRPKDSLQIDAVFAPQTQQVYFDTLHLVDDSLREYNIPLTGAGRRFVGVLSVADTVDFGDMFVGDTTMQSLPLRNIGNARLVISGAQFAAATLDFSASPTLPICIDTTMNDAIQAFFHPSVTGPVSATYEIRDSLAGRADGVQHVHDVVFLGRGIPPLVAVVAIDSGYTAPVGGMISIPVELRSDISKSLSTSFQFDVRYDGTLLYPRSLAPTAITSSTNLSMTETSPGVLSISGNGSSPLIGTGLLCTVTYEVLASTNTTTPLAVTDAVVGNGRNPRSVQMINGLFAVSGGCGSPITPRTTATHITPNVPNPFSAATSIHYVVGVPSHVTIAVYDGVGRMVANLVDQDYTPGAYEARFDSRDLPNGMYYCRMSAGAYVTTQSMMLMR